MQQTVAAEDNKMKKKLELPISDKFQYRGRGERAKLVASEFLNLQEDWGDYFADFGFVRN